MKKTFKSILALVVALLLTLCFVGCGSDSSDDLPLEDITGQEVLSESTSPDDSYTITAYLNNGDSKTDYAVLCVIKDNKSKDERNIYYNTDGANANIQWVDDDTVVINGIVLEAKNGEFDNREK